MHILAPLTLIIISIVKATIFPSIQDGLMNNVWYQFGLLPEVGVLLLRNLDYLDVGRMKQVSKALNSLLSNVVIDWIPTKRLTEEEKLLLIKAVKIKCRQDIKRILGMVPFPLISTMELSVAAEVY